MLRTAATCRKALLQVFPPDERRAWWHAQDRIRHEWWLDEMHHKTCSGELVIRQVYNIESAPPPLPPCRTVLRQNPQSLRQHLPPENVAIVAGLYEVRPSCQVQDCCRGRVCVNPGHAVCGGSAHSACREAEGAGARALTPLQAWACICTDRSSSTFRRIVTAPQSHEGAAWRV